MSQFGPGERCPQTMPTCAPPVMSVGGASMGMDTEEELGAESELLRIPSQVGLPVNTDHLIGSNRELHSTETVPSKGLAVTADQQLQGGPLKPIFRKFRFTWNIFPPFACVCLDRKSVV